MRLITDAEVRSGTIERLRALSPELEVVDRTGDPTFDVMTLADPDVEVIIGGDAPDDLGRVPSLRWLQVRSAGRPHGRRPSVAEGPPRHQRQGCLRR
jgi:hypothetical protein